MINNNFTFIFFEENNLNPHLMDKQMKSSNKTRRKPLNDIVSELMHQNFQGKEQNCQKQFENIIFNKAKVMKKFMRLNSIGKHYILWKI